MEHEVAHRARQHARRPPSWPGMRCLKSMVEGGNGIHVRRWGLVGGSGASGLVGQGEALEIQLPRGPPGCRFGLFLESKSMVSSPLTDTPISPSL